MPPCSECLQGDLLEVLAVPFFPFSLVVQFMTKTAAWTPAVRWLTQAELTTAITGANEQQYNMETMCRAGFDYTWKDHMA